VVGVELIKIPIDLFLVFVEALHQHFDTDYVVFIFAIEQGGPFLFSFSVLLQMLVLFSNDFSLDFQFIHKDIFLDKILVEVGSLVMGLSTL